MSDLMKPPPDEQNRWPGAIHGMPAPPGWEQPGQGAAQGTGQGTGQRTGWAQPTQPSPVGWAPRPDQPAPKRPSKWVPLLVSLALVATLVVGAVTAIGLSNNGSSGGSGGTPGVAAQTGIVDINTFGKEIGAPANQLTPMGAGTGMVLTSNGEVLTNNHVVKGAWKIQVRVPGGSSYTASVVGVDPAHDVALIQLQDASGLSTISPGDSSSVSVGENVAGIGNALGRGGTPTAVGGVVTDLGQTITAGDSGDATNETLTNMIQIQAPIQPGDSGGPLVDGSGKVIGMTTAADSTAGGFGQDTSGNTGFAIPINKAKSIADQIADGQASASVHIGARALLGVSTSDQDTSNQGAYVAGVESGSGADSAGIQAQDTVTAINGKDVADADSLRAALSTLHPGDSVRVTYVDPGGSQHQVNVKLGTGTPD